MLKNLSRLFAGAPDHADTTVLREWAEQRGHHWLRVRGMEGGVVEGRTGPLAWRMEWGLSQRDYIDGFELRLIAELDLPKELVAMVLNRALMETMEATVYERYVDDVQTRIDTDTPPEMRWLVLYPKTTNQDLGRLRDRYAAVCSIEPWMQQWLEGSLNNALAATLDLTPPEQPVVMTIGRGRLLLRTPMATLDARQLAMWFSVFDHALREAHRLGTEWREGASPGLTTQPSAWARSELPGNPPPDIKL